MPRKKTKPQEPLPISGGKQRAAKRQARSNLEGRGRPNLEWGKSTRNKRGGLKTGGITKWGKRDMALGGNGRAKIDGLGGAAKSQSSLKKTGRQIFGM